MNTRLAILCSGQGAQHPGMFDLALAAPGNVQRLRDWALEPALGMPLESALVPQRMFANRIAQPLLVAAALAVWESLRPRLPSPVLIAGYSVGELTAHAVAGAIPPSEAISLAVRRAQLMDACKQPDRPQTLFAVSGLRLPVLAPLLARHDLFVAIDNGESAFIVGGLEAVVPAFAGEAEAAGAQVKQLPVDVASHTPLMDSAAAGFMDALNASTLGAPLIPVLSGIEGRAVTKREKGIDSLGRQLKQTIRWAACMDALAEAGVGIALELGPGAALSRMLAERHPGIRARSVSDFRTLDGVVNWVERQLD